MTAESPFALTCRIYKQTSTASCSIATKLLADLGYSRARKCSQGHLAYVSL